ncbi:MAG TPA: hypothetical protein DIT32_00275 [Peptococcaceae bacterium]|nr:hypothetical protein [Peptococcaceae bacterium]
MWRKLITSACFLVLLGCLALYLRDHLTIAQLAEQELTLRTKIDEAPWSSFATGLLIYSLVSLVPGTSGKSIVCGYLFGFWQSLVMVLAGLANAAMATFFMSRYVVRDWVEKKFSGLLAGMNVMIDRDGAFYLLTLRMAHIPFSLINYCSGATRISAWTFLWTTVAGLLPGTILFVYIGSQLPTLHELVTHGAASLINPKIAAGLIGMAFFPLLIRYMVKVVKPCGQKNLTKCSDEHCHKEEKAR